MSDLKTKPHDGDVNMFLDAVTNDTRRKDSLRILAIMEDITGESPVLWGPSIVGFGSYHYKYASGREGEWPIVGFSPRKQSLTVYIMPGFDRYEDLMTNLGKHRVGRSCLYINKLTDIDEDILQQLITESVEYMRAQYG